MKMKVDDGTTRLLMGSLSSFTSSLEFPEDTAESEYAKYTLVERDVPLRFAVGVVGKRVRIREATPVGLRIDVKKTVEVATRPAKRKVEAQILGKLPEARTSSLAARVPLELDFSDIEDALETQRRALETFAKESGKAWGFGGDDRALMRRHLLEFLRTPRKATIRLTDFSREKQIPERVVRWLLDKFADASGDRKIKYVRSQLHQNSIVFHILLVALEQGQVNVASVANDLGFKKAALTPYFKELGCVVNKGIATRGEPPKKKPRL